ncbi:MULTISPECIES: hypothetical protein [unclassified Thalassolituus]|uniref:hypothetical protein n=1 Tax=unclassified Thalassolituus TaxID=2624967 RepID=UPI0025D870C3|nr:MULTISPECIES: hypothetical protein [unclassified Thalassolituus]|tara:strand:- start:3488 stop:4000 length:513 start_codon:yes stop_codon:yes gene_type:complete
MKYRVLTAIMLTHALAQSAFAADDAAMAADISDVKRSVLELNKDLYELEESLLSPSVMRAELYFSLNNGHYFDPLSVEVTAEGMKTVQHIYTERQIDALKMGAVQPLAEVNLGPGKHTVKAVVRGKDAAGQPRELIVEREVEKKDKPLLLEIVVADDSSLQSARASLRFW